MISSQKEFWPLGVTSNKGRQNLGLIVKKGLLERSISRVNSGFSVDPQLEFKKAVVHFSRKGCKNINLILLFMVNTRMEARLDTLERNLEAWR